MLTYGQQLEKQNYDKGHTAGRATGGLEGQRTIILELMTERFQSVSNSVVQRVNRADTDHLKRWARRILTAKNLDDVFAEF